MSPIALNSNSYAVARRFGRAIRAVGVMAWSLALLQACSNTDATSPATTNTSNGSPTDSKPVGQLAGSAVVGSALESPVRLVVTGSDSKPLAGVKVKWTAGDGGSVSARETTTDATGIASVRWTLGIVAGPQSLIANVAELPPVVFGANAVADRAAVVRFSTDLVRVTVLGDTVAVSATVADRFGNAVVAPITFGVEAGSDALVSAGPVFVARKRGTAVIRAIADTASARLVVLVDPIPPVVTRVSPDTLVPGASIVIEGLGFALLPDLVEVTVAGVKATVTKALASRIEATLPTTYGCLATGAQPVKVTVAAVSGELASPFRTARLVALARGESANILESGEVRCTELVAPVGESTARYIVAVINTSVTASATSGFEFRGAGTGAMARQVATPLAMPRVSSPASNMMMSAPVANVRGVARGFATQMPSIEEKAEAKHDAYLDSQRALNARFGSPAPTWRARAKARSAMGSAAVRAPTALGDTVTMKALYASCAAGRDVRARVVYVGAKSLVLEDIAAPLAGSMDEQYRLIGDEYDRVQYPMMVNLVGDPLAMNDAMSGDGRVTMLFTRYVNDSLPGIAGYISACNFYPKSTFGASNEDDIFYARVPHAGESPTEWRRSIRGTVIHESKHLASFAIRFANGTAFEESWLEESLGRVAEELYSRTFANGGAWKGNSGYQSTVRCEVYQCDDRPLMMWKHFSVLQQYMRGVDTLTPIGAAANGDFTFYASGWSLVRWAADHYAADEATWIKAMVRGGQLTGLSNLAQRTGRPVDEMLADWALSNAVGSLTGFTPARQQLTFPSWNVADVFAGLAGTFPSNFVANPLRARAMSFGSFSLAVAKLRAFSSSYFSFEGVQSGNQLLELRGEGGAALPPPSLRLAVVRVE